MAIQRAFHIRPKHIIAIVLAGFGGFFVAQKLTAPTQSRTQAQTQDQGIRQQSLEAAPMVPSDREADILARLGDVMGGLRKQADRVKDPSARFSLALPDRPRAAKIDTANPRASAQPAPTASATQASAKQPPSSATLSPFLPSSKVSIAGLARVMVEDVNLSAFIDSQNQKSLTVQMRARNRGTAPSTVNTPIKLFMTMASGNSIVLGEQLIPPLQPNEATEKKATYQCPESGIAQVCVTIPAEFSVAANGPAERTVCSTVTVPEVPAASAASTTSSSTAATSSSSATTAQSTSTNTGSTGSNALDPACLCNR